MSKFIFLSSGAVYGDLEASRSAIRETDAIGLDPVNRNRELHTLGISKLAAEHFCDLRCEAIGNSIPYVSSVSLARIFHNQSIMLQVTFKMRPEQTIHPDQWQSQTKKKLPLCRRLCSVALCALCMDGNQKIYNIGSDQAVTMLELAKNISTE